MDVAVGIDPHAGFDEADAGLSPSVKAAAIGIGFWSMTSVATLICVGSAKRMVIGTIAASSARAGASSVMTPSAAAIGRL